MVTLSEYVQFLSDLLEKHGDGQVRFSWNDSQGNTDDTVPPDVAWLKDRVRTYSKGYSEYPPRGNTTMVYDGPGDREYCFRYDR